MKLETEVSTDITEMQTIIKDMICQQIGHPRRNKFLEKKNLSRLNQKKKNRKLNILITSNYIELVVKKPKKIKSPRSDSFTGKLYQIFKVE